MRTHYKCFDCGCDSFEIEFEKGVEIRLRHMQAHPLLAGPIRDVEHIHLRPEQIIVVCKKCHAVISDGFQFPGRLKESISGIRRT